MINFHWGTLILQANFNAVAYKPAWSFFTNNIKVNDGEIMIKKIMAVLALFVAMTVIIDTDWEISHEVTIALGSDLPAIK